ncbi:uncharacterized protein LOC120903283 [Anopheles arabiensis]|uniref:Salivary thrombin inhibitor anophelin n=6 Tax=gambiae species complex TaxID=44542 RepID=SATPA_ANOGA|nr:uncharacterized protein LOC120903283 [Anopheles arabiensis]XP_040231929.1 uncharacterized protein LOC120955277 [Anopheles coluzzii]EAA12433.3 AGAP008004-PA [Anopheles gambiae str. PEST]
MASKLFVLAFLCLALVVVVQSAPQYARGDVPTYDEEDFDEESLKPHSSSSSDDGEEEFDPSLLEEHADAPTARDPGRNPEFLRNSNTDEQASAPAASSSESDE